MHEVRDERLAAEEAMYLLELTTKEREDLELTLARRSAEMLNELVHTTDRKAHAELKASYEKLEILQRRVSALSPAPA
jgi:hypothetical protein